MHNRFFRVFFISALFLMSFQLIALSQRKGIASSKKGKGYIIHRVEVIGSEPLDDNAVYRTIGLLPTEIYKHRALNSAANRLNKLGRFERVTKENFKLKFNHEEGIVDITVRLKEKPDLKSQKK